LADSRPFVALNDLAYISSKRVTQIPPELITAVRDAKEQKDYIKVANMPAAHENFLTRGVWPGPAGWQRETGEPVTPADLPRLEEVVHAMAKR
jgi:hypothetical protein